MLERVRARPAARIAGFTVQAMVDRKSGAQELIVGASIDRVFGPVILFGQAARRWRCWPIAPSRCRRSTSRWRARWWRARAWPGCCAASATRRRPTRPALHRVLMAVSQLLADIPQIAELDINPLIVDARGAVALDARIRVSMAAPPVR